MELNNYIKSVQSGEMDIVEETKKTIETIEKLNSEYDCLSIITKDLAIECAESLKKNPNKDKLPLAGVFISVKDCVCVKDVESTASSKILKSYKPVFDATVVKKVKEAGAIIIGKTIQDEFGFGTFSTNTGIDYPTPKNPIDKERSTGGSSGGCGSITKLCETNNIPHISIAESTGGSIECPASFCGVIGFCPTYGKVSRNGLMSYSNSLDKIGIMGSTCEDVALGVNTISGEDLNESTSVASEEIILEKKDAKDFKVGYIELPELNPEIKATYDNKINQLKESGATIEKIDMPITFEYALSAYYIIAMSEASTNLSCLCGLRYGAQKPAKGKHFTEYFSEIRSKNFGVEAKRRIILGTFTRMAGYRDAFYIRAAKTRTKVIEEYKSQFEKYDIIISPTMPFIAPKFEDISKLKTIDHYMADILTVGPNLAGIPHMSIPIGTNTVNNNKEMPIGMMIIADHFNEKAVLEFGTVIESLNGGQNE